MQFIFMDFKLPRIENGVELWDIISISLDHIAAVCACDDNWKHSFIELDSGKVYEVIGCSGDILEEIMETIRESRC